MKTLLQTWDGILHQVDETLDLFNELQLQHQAMSTKTKTLHDACDRLLIEKQRLIEFAEALRSKLKYFDELENVRATLEEISKSSLLVHVVDISHPLAEQQIDAMDKVLSELDVASIPKLMVGNKLMASTFPLYSAIAANKCMNLLQQQQSDTQRATVALMMGEDMHKFGRSRLDRNEFLMNSGLEMVNLSSKQIYLTFPADNTFREENVSNYSSIYGPVQNVRIPYQ
ncbi:hypothetical protein CsSME_00011774 [Camellia sinensis var. sinensis]